MIVKIELIDSDLEETTILFGTSYKNYLDQIKDFFYRTQKWIDHVPHPVYEIISIEASNSKWKSWGGLKWCVEENFQHELNREGCQQNDPDNPNPRQYSEMEFKKNYYVDARVMDWYNTQYQEREIVELKSSTIGR